MTTAEREQNAARVIEEAERRASRRSIVLGYLTGMRQNLDAIASLSSLYDDVMDSLSGEDLAQIDEAVTALITGLAKF